MVPKTRLMIMTSMRICGDDADVVGGSDDGNNIDHMIF